MRRLSRVLVAVGTVGMVLVARWAHVRFRGDIEGVSAYLALAAVLIAAAFAVGLPGEPRDWQPAMLSSALAVVIGTGAFLFVRVFTPNLLPRFVLLVVPIMLVPWYVMCWRLDNRGSNRRRVRERVLAVLDAADIDTLRSDSDREFPRPEEPYTLVAAVEPGEAIGDRLMELVAQHDISLLVLGPSAQLIESIVEQAGIVHRQGVRVRTLEMFYDQWLGKLVLSEVGRMALLTDIGSVHDRQYASLKRMIDLAIAGIGAVGLVVVTPLVAIGNLFANRGPLFFRQTRTGLDEEPFRIIKFRTMQPSIESGDWTVVGDDRITPFGGFLRRIHLDELPQVVNVLRGTLSIVGPRPEQATYVAELERKLPFYSLRHVVKPGLTGWAQVKYRYGATEEESFEKLQYDLYYVRHHSLLFDLKTISRTIRQVLFARGR